MGLYCGSNRGIDIWLWHIEKCLGFGEKEKEEDASL